MLSLEYLASLSALCKARNLALHMDGARVFNAATALGVPLQRITSCVTSVQFCLSKVGLKRLDAAQPCPHSPGGAACLAAACTVHSAPAMLSSSQLCRGWARQWAASWRGQQPSSPRCIISAKCLAEECARLVYWQRQVTPPPPHPNKLATWYGACTCTQRDEQPTVSQWQRAACLASQP